LLNPDPDLGFKNWVNSFIMFQEKPPALQREHPALQKFKTRHFFFGEAVLAFLGPDLNRVRIQPGSGSETKLGVP